MQRLITKSPKQTEALGKQLAREIGKQPHGKTAKLVLLYGDLGGGKTTFTRGFAKTLGVSRVTSPTFIMSRRSKTQHAHITNFFHLDLYRVPEKGGVGEKKAMLEGIGFFDALRDPKHIMLVEWAERMKGVRLPQNTKVRFRYGKTESERIITLS
jgi:tRNA threonylcarbamoyladenosine biosynthesis protein TsaE